MKLYTLDRSASLSEGLEATLFKFDDIRPTELQNHLDILFPTGVSKHGDQYFASRLNANNLGNGILELVFEYVRRAHYPDKPSRLQSIFSCDDLELIKTFHLQFGIQNTIPNVWEIEADEFFRGDLQWIRFEPTALGVSNNAHNYWKGLPKSENPFWEYLVRIPIKIGKKITI